MPAKRHQHLYDAADAMSQNPEHWEAIRDGDRDVRDKMVEVHVFMLEAVAMTLKNNLPSHIDVEDLKSYGSLGLMRAVDTYDAAKGAFRTHAVIAIRGKILDELRSIDWAPKSLRRKARDLEKMTAQLRKDLNREPTDEELAEALEIPFSQIGNTRLAVRHSTHKSFDDIHPHSESQREADPEDYSSNVAGLAFVDLCLQEMTSWFDSLDFNEQVVIALYYYKDYKLAEIAHETGLSEAWVVSTHSQRVSELRDRLLKLTGEEEA